MLSLAGNGQGTDSSPGRTQELSTSAPQLPRSLGGNAAGSEHRKLTAVDRAKIRLAAREIRGAFHVAARCGSSTAPPHPLRRATRALREARLTGRAAVLQRPLRRATRDAQDEGHRDRMARSLGAARLCQVQAAHPAPATQCFARLPVLTPLARPQAVCLRRPRPCVSLGGGWRGLPVWGKEHVGG